MIYILLYILITLPIPVSAGAVSWTLVYPFDVIKSNIQVTPAADQMNIYMTGRKLVNKHGNLLYTSY